jgi:hypothetical protein
MGHFKNDEHHGQCIVIDIDGEKCIPNFIDGLQDGN